MKKKAPGCRINAYTLNSRGGGSSLRAQGKERGIYLGLDLLD